MRLERPQSCPYHRDWFQNEPEDIERFSCHKKVQWQGHTRSQNVQTKHRRLFSCSTQPFDSKDTQTDSLNDIPFPDQIKMLDSTKLQMNECTQTKKKFLDGGDHAVERIPKTKSAKEKDYPACQCFKDNCSFNNINPDPFSFVSQMSKPNCLENFEIVKEPFSIVARLEKQEILAKKIVLTKNDEPFKTKSIVTKKRHCGLANMLQGFFRKFKNVGFARKQNSNKNRKCRCNQKIGVRNCRKTHYDNCRNDNCFCNMEPPSLFQIIHYPNVLEEEVENYDTFITYHTKSDSAVNSENLENSSTNSSELQEVEYPNVS